MKEKIKKFIVTRNLFGRTQRNKFESGGFYYYGGQRATFSKALSYIQKAGKALDIGAGFGNEVKVLLKKSWKVVATDPNPEAVAYLQKVAKKQPDLVVLEQTLPDFPEGSFDLVVCEMVLHFLKNEEAYQSIKNIQRVTEKGGINVISSYIEQPIIHTDPRIAPGYFTFLLQPDELKQLYADWEILYYEETGNATGFTSARLIARKV